MLEMPGIIIIATIVFASLTAPLKAGFATTRMIPLLLPGHAE